MPNIVIAGAGPIGLYTAILLRSRYPDFTVTILDERIGAFSRPGVIATGALDAINDSFEQLEISRLEVSECGSHPPAIHIRDLQQALYEKANSLGVTLIQKNYSAIEGKQVKIEDDEEDIPAKLLPCDLLIDCTGNDRVATETVLRAKEIADNPIKYHFLAYIYVEVEKENTSFLLSSAPITPETLGTFRSNTGWSEFVAPEIDNPPRRWQGPLKHNQTQYAAKYCLYFEIPSDLKRENYSAYLRELLKLKYGKDIDFTPSADPGAFNKFEVSPKVLENFVGEIGDTPVVALGDALVSAEYRYGTGIENGVAGAYMLTGSLSWNGTRMSVDQDAWRKQEIDIPRYRRRNVDAVVGDHKERICDDYASKKRSLLRAKDAAYIKYTQTPSTVLDFDKLLFANHCKKKGDVLFKNLELSKSQEQYLEAINLYAYCSENLSGSRAIEARDKHIKTISNLGKSYCKLNDFNRSIDCFLDAMFFAKKYGIIEMMDINKLPKSLSDVVALKLNFFGSDFQGKKDFLEKLIARLSSIEINTNKYNEEQQKIEITISNIEKMMEAKSAIHEDRPDSSVDVLNEAVPDLKK